MLLIVSCDNQTIQNEDPIIEYSLSSSVAPARCCVWSSSPTKDLELFFNNTIVKQTRNSQYYNDTLCFMVEESTNYDLIVSSDEFGFSETINIPNIKNPNFLKLNSIKYISDVNFFKPKILEIEYSDKYEKIILNEYDYILNEEKNELIFTKPLEFAFNIGNEFGLTITIRDEQKTLPLYIMLNSYEMYNQRIPFENVPELDNYTSYPLRLVVDVTNEFNFNFYAQVEWEYLQN